MEVGKAHIRYVQRKIGADDDGLIGSETARLLERKITLIPKINKSWAVERKLIAYLQFLGLSRSIEMGEIDGYFGPQTEYGFEQLIYLEKYRQFPPQWRDEEEPDKKDRSEEVVNPHGFPSYDKITDYYGKAGQQLVTVTAPFFMRLAWDTRIKVKRITCHKKVSESLLGVLENSRDHYGLSEIINLGIDLFGGIYNHRKMRGGRNLSTHAWGVAIDLDPARNKLRWNHLRAEFAKADYDYLREAFRVEGWVSLGVAKDYDWMHFQAVRV